ncbi:hypothetical protein V2G26_019797 [Clonostachys chloroleuca]
MVPRKVYRDVKLDPTTDSIRLARIIHSNHQDGSDIRLKLEKFQLSSAPSFYALSYTWGAPNECKAIFVNGEKFLIRENLWYFLWQGRIPDQCQYLWIDALCINQEDAVEKSHQVHLMGKIYSKALLVLVWLGVAADGSDFVMDIMESRGACVDHSVQGHLQWYAEINYAGRDLAHFHPSCVATCTSIIKFFERQYWKRVWIVQELCLARDRRVLCGTKAVEFPCLQTLWGSSVSLCEDDFLSPVLRLVCQIARTGKKPAFHLRELLIHTKPQQCGDKHDRVYALLGLLENGTYDIPVDYECTMNELYRQVLRSIFVFDKGSYRLPMKLEFLRKSLSIGEMDEAAKWETEAYQICCERLELADDFDTKLGRMHKAAWKASRADGERFRSNFLEGVRKGGREFCWAEETVVLEPYTVGYIHNHRWQKFLESQ